MEFASYPMDKQICHFKIQSLKYNTERLRMRSTFHFSKADSESQDFDIDIYDLPEVSP
jgi:hypothetical protein